VTEAHPIAILHYSAPPVVGGVEIVFTEHARQLVRAGHSVKVVAGRGGDGGLPDAAQVAIIPEIDSEYPANLEIGEALARGPAPPAFDALSDRIEATLAEALYRAQIVMAHNVLSMHFNMPLLAALHRLIGQPGAPRFIAWCHDVSRYVRPSSGATQRPEYPWDLLRTYLPNVTYVAVSEERRQHLVEVLGCPPENIRVVPNGVDADSLLGLSRVGRHLVETFDLQNADVILLMPVRLTRAKNIEFSLRVTSGLKSAGLEPRLIITGPPDPHAPDGLEYYQGLLTLRDELGLRGQAVFVFEGTPELGTELRIDLPVVAELYRACDVVLLPSLREGFGIPILEAGMIYRPIYATHIPAVDVIGAETVHLIEPDEPASRVAERIAGWAEQDPTHRLRVRVRRSYTWDGIFRTMIEPLIIRDEQTTRVAATPEDTTS
jgi:glycosyltransferase involved in cell wall biosynthesis